MFEEKAGTYFEEETSRFEKYLPTNLPPKFERFDKSLWCNKCYKGLQVYYKNKDGKVIRLELSDGPISDPMSMSPKPAEDFHKEIRGVPVSIKCISIKPAAGRKDEEDVSLITAYWAHSEVYFSLWSDGLIIDQAEKLIDSTIH